MRRLILRGIAVLIGLYVVLTAALFGVMRQTPDAFGRVMAHMPSPFMMVLPFESLWMHARSGHLDSGDTAPDFRLPTLDHSSQVQLSSFRGSRPVVLVFGSYT